MFRGSILVILTLTFSCSQQKPKVADQKSTYDKQSCEHSVSYGVVDICLPIIDGMTECYSNPKVKIQVDKFTFEGNTILAHYLNDSTFKQIDNVENLSYDKYFQIYVTDSFKNAKFGQADFKRAIETVNNNYFKENWADLKDRIEKSVKYNIDNLSINKPIIIEDYSLNDDIHTFVMLWKLQAKNRDHFAVTTLNIARIKERLIWLVYFKDYEGEESIKICKSYNDYMSLQILNENKH